MTFQEKKHASIQWWNQLTFEQKFYKVIAWLKSNDRDTTEKHPNDLTAKEIQEIWHGTHDWLGFGRAVLAFVFVFWFLFDTLLNVVRGEKPWHLGTHFIDQLQVKYGGEFTWFVWKAILFAFALANYFLDPITGIWR